MQVVSPTVRDPAWAGRVFWALAGLAVLWPALVLAEFKPWVLLEPGALKPALHFVGDFFPPRADAEFVLLLAREFLDLIKQLGGGGGNLGRCRLT